MSRTPQETLGAHFDAVGAGDLTRLLADYAEDAVILTGDGVLQGHSGVQAFYANALQLLPEAQFAVGGTTYSDDAALVHWTAQSNAGRIDDGVDTFVFRDGNIRLHTIHFTIDRDQPER